tara:strand:+ start:153 stop:554 length:402 start_codon:yes stop_codon:yes gene_type:complete
MLKSIDKNHEINFIAKGSVLEGSLNSESDIRVDGCLRGSIKTGGRIVLGETGVIEGEVSCKTAIIGGELKASIVSQDLLTLKSTAKLTGEIIAGKLAIEPGAVFSGKCSMGPVIKDINKNNENKASTTKEKIA